MERTAHLNDFQQTLNDELLSHMQETDESLPVRHGAYEYYTRTVQGQSYAIHCRRLRKGKGNASQEEVLLDENLLAQGKPHLDIGSFQMSPSHNFGAFLADFTGYETYDLYIFKAGETPLASKPELVQVSDFQWGSPDETDLYYTTMDKAQRANAVWRHVVGTAQQEDKRVFVEDNALFSVGIWRSRDDALLFIGVGSAETSETRYVRLGVGGGGAARLETVRRRTPGVRYSVDHRNGTLFVITNAEGHRNSALRQCPLGACVTWQPVLLSNSANETVEALPYSENRSLTGVYAFKGYVAVTGREDGLTQVWVLDGHSSKLKSVHRVQWPDSAYWCGVNDATEFASPLLLLKYSTLVKPFSDIAYDVSKRSHTTLRISPVPQYDPELYATETLHAEAADGTRIPISLLFRRDLWGGGGGAVHLYGYGSYGMPVEPSFSITRLPLVDRGVTYAIAHVRGGGEFGRWRWYEEGAKYLWKKNTFTDFIACADHLLATGWASGPDRLSIEGRSAGGLLVGAVLNIRPDLFAAAVAGVPFVDVLVTMSDPSIPLTVGEWEEWGNPNKRRYFEYMQSYSPVDNIRRQPYPSILITAGLYDPRVAYWEPAKYAQVLRERRTNPPDDGKDVLLKVDLTAGHFSASDRYQYLNETAFDYAWLLAELGFGPPRPECSSGRRVSSSDLGIFV